MQGIYVWVCAVNGKVYVGSAKNIAVRRTAHLRALKSGNHHSPHFQRAWNAYGPEAFEFVVLEEVEDEVWLRAKETVWLNRLQSFKGGFGYNIARDGWSGAQFEPTERRLAAWKANGNRRRGVKDSPEVRARKKMASQGRTPPSHLGHKHSAKTKLKMRMASLARKRRGDNYKFTPEDTLRGVMATGLKNKARWQNPQERKSLSAAQSKGWTPEVRALKSQQVKQWWAEKKVQESVV